MTGIYCPVRLRTGRRRWRVSSPPGSTRALSQIIVRVVSPVSSPVLLPRSPHQITKYSSLSPQKKTPRPGSLQYHIHVAATVAVFPSSYYRRHDVLPVLSVIDSVQVPVKIESEKLASHIRHIFDQSYIYIYSYMIRAQHEFRRLSKIRALWVINAIQTSWTEKFSKTIIDDKDREFGALNKRDE